MASRRSINGTGALSAREIAERLDCGDLEVGQSRKVHAPYRDDSNASLNVTRKQRTFTFCDFGIDYTQGETLKLLRRHFSRNGGRPLDQSCSLAPAADDASPLDWWADYTKVPRDVWEVLGCDEDEHEVVFEFFGADAEKRRKKGTTNYRWQGRTTPPLWPAPEETLPKEIGISEGESDAGTLRHCGVHCFATTKGASAQLSADLFRELRQRGVEHVTVYSDTDSAGLAFRAATVAEVLTAGLDCSYCDISPYCDLTLGENDFNALYLRVGKSAFQKTVKEATVEVERPAYVNSLAEVLTWADEDEGWLIQDLVARGTKTLIAAPAKSLKTFFTLHLIGCCSTCSPLLGAPEYRIPHALKTLLVEEEGSRPMFGKRMRRVLHSMEGEAKEEPDFRFRRGFSLLDPSQVTELIEHLTDRGTDLLILDPLQRITPGVDENSNSDMRRVWDAVNRILLKVPDLAVIVVAHNRKGDALTPEATRGAGLTLGEYDLGIFLQKQDDFTRTETTYQGTLALTLDGRELPQEYTKARGAMEVEYAFDHAADTFTMRATGGTLIRVRATAKAAGKANEQGVLDAICQTTSQGATKEEVCAATGLAPRTVEKHLAKLTEEEQLMRSEIPQQKGGVKGLWKAVEHA